MKPLPTNWSYFMVMLETSTGGRARRGKEAIRLVARTEAIFLDPVYSSKAMAALIDQIHQGHIGRDKTVVLLHTGGTPTLYAFARQLLDE